MPKQFGSQIDLQKIPVIGLVAEQKSTAPTSPVNGQLWYDTSNNVTKVYDNGSFVLIGNAAVGGTLTVQDENTTVGSSVAQLDFQGAGVTASAGAGEIIITIPGGGPPTGAVGGTDIGGTYPSSLTINNLAVTAAKIANATITDTQVAAANKDGVAGTASMRTLGTGATQAASGTDSRFTDSRAPSGAVGGTDIGGTYPSSLTINNLAVTAAKIANATITDTQVAAANKDGVTGTASMRTLGTGAQQALAGNTRLDQITAPTASVNMNTQKIIGLVDPTNPQEAATKFYVDAVATGLDPKGSVRIASTANITGTYTAAGGTSTRGQLTAMPNTAIDGVTPVVNNRVLLKNQSTAAQNGIWVITTLGTGANGVWDRAADFDADAEVTNGAHVFVEEGTVNVSTGWVLTNPNPITIGGASGTALTWSQFSGAGAVIAGAGLVQNGQAHDVVGTANRISVAADSIDISTAYVGQATITTLGTITTGTWTGTDIAVADGGTGASTAPAARTNLGAVGKFSSTLAALSAGTPLTINHALNTSDVHAMFRDASTGRDITFEWAVTDANNITVTADIAYGASAIRAVVMG